MGIKIIFSNKKAFHNFQIGERYEAGMVLKGTEIKALRAGKVNLGDGWIDITGEEEAILKDAYIGHYEFGNRMNHEERRPRKLLLHKKEILKLSHLAESKGYSIVPIKIYFKGQRVKLEIGLGKGKKLYDKRETSKKRTADREMERALKL